MFSSGYKQAGGTHIVSRLEMKAQDTEISLRGITLWTVCFRTYIPLYVCLVASPSFLAVIFNKPYLSSLIVLVPMSSMSPFNNSLYRTLLLSFISDKTCVSTPTHNLFPSPIGYLTLITDDLLMTISTLLSSTYHYPWDANPMEILLKIYTTL